jgi:hypothetical protein
MTDNLVELKVCHTPLDSWKNRASFVSMKAIALMLSLVCVVPVCGQDADFDKLQTAYKSAVEKALKPINATYEVELRKILAKQTAAKDLAAAKITVEEIEKVTGMKDEQSRADTSSKEMEKLIVGRVWRMTGGARFDFKKTGEGVRIYNNEKTAFLWRIGSSGCIEVTGQLGSGGTFRTFFFRITSLKDASYGDDPGSTNLPLTLES